MTTATKARPATDACLCGISPPRDCEKHGAALRAADRRNAIHDNHPVNGRVQVDPARDDCTIPEKILLAAAALEAEQISPFSAEALIVAAWKMFPRVFGLRGFADLHPDSNKVMTSVMGEKGLVRRGYLAKMGKKLYMLTREGRQRVRRLAQRAEEGA